MLSFIFILLLGILPFTIGGVLKSNRTLSCDSENVEHSGNYFPILSQVNFTKCENITSLSFPRNYIRIILNDTFKYLEKIKSIDFSFNNISTLPTEIFNSTPQIEDINFSYNNFTFLQKNLFTNLSTLVSVNFEFNKIEYVDEKCFVNVSTLTSINLANNNLKTLQFNIIDDIKSLEKIYLSGNPWHCDPNLCETMNAVVSKFWNDEPVCNTPYQIRNTTWKQFVEQPKPVIIKKFRDKENDFNNSVTMQCYSCSNTTLVWMLLNETFSYETNETSSEHLTISTFTIDPFTPSDVYFFCYAKKYIPDILDDWNLADMPDFTKNVKFDFADSSFPTGRTVTIGIPVGGILSLLVRCYYKYLKGPEEEATE